MVEPFSWFEHLLDMMNSTFWLPRLVKMTSLGKGVYGDTINRCNHPVSLEWDLNPMRSILMRVEGRKRDGFEFGGQD